MHTLRLLLWRLRFVIAAVCAGVGTLIVVHAVRPAPPPALEVVVTLRDVMPGVPLTADDVGLMPRPSDSMPTSALTDVTAAVGHEAAVMLSADQVLTGPLVGAGSPTDLAPADTVVVPVRLDGTADILRAGDRIDLLAPPPSDEFTDVKTRDDGTTPATTALTLAHRALVLPRTTDTETGGGILGGTAESSNVLLVAVAPGEAPALATAPHLAAVLVP